MIPLFWSRSRQPIRRLESNIPCASNSCSGITVTGSLKYPTLKGSQWRATKHRGLQKIPSVIISAFSVCHERRKGNNKKTLSYYFDASYWKSARDRLQYYGNKLQRLNTFCMIFTRLRHSWWMHSMCWTHESCEWPTSRDILYEWAISLVYDAPNQNLHKFWKSFANTQGITVNLHNS